MSKYVTSPQVIVHILCVKVPSVALRLGWTQYPGTVGYFRMAYGNGMQCLYLRGDSPFGISCTMKRKLETRIGHF